MKDPTYQQLNDYSQYLQTQVEKFSAFMVTQKHLNEKHALIQNKLDQTLHKIHQLQQKVQIIQINSNDNSHQIQKFKAQKQTLKSMELRIQNIEHQISSLLKSQNQISLNQSSYNFESQPNIQQKSHPTNKKLQKSEQNNYISPQLTQQNLDFIEKYLSNVFMEKQQVQQIISKTKDEIDFKVKKLQIEIQKNKQSFFKLTSQINNLTNKNYYESPFIKQFKGEKRLNTQSTKDLNIQPISHENMITKKQLKKMEKKLQNFFTQKLQSIKSEANNKEPLSKSNQKGLKFKRIQQKYDRLSAEMTYDNRNRSEQRVLDNDKKSSSQKKISLFDNQILRQRHGEENYQIEIKSNKKKKLKGQIQSPINYLQSPRNYKQVKSSRSQHKKIIKRRSPDRLKRVNQDYMISL